MKTYNLICAFLALMAIGCQKSDEISTDGDGEGNGVKADYDLLLRNDGMVYAQLLSANGNQVSVNSRTSSFTSMPMPELTARTGMVWGRYYSEPDCSGKVILHDFGTDLSTEIPVFTDITSCQLTATDLVHTPSTLFISFWKEIDGSSDLFYVRSMDRSSGVYDFVDIQLNQKPLQVVYTNERLFVLTVDEQITGENGLSVVDTSTNTLINEMNLGFDARQLFLNADGNLIIAYDELHSILNSQTLKFGHTNYEEGKAPNFAMSNHNFFDTTGNSLYYEMARGDLLLPTVPAIYNFTENKAYLYFYENFLTENELLFEYEIANTTMVSYDPKNNFLLVGYQKKSTTQKGGLLRIKPAPDPRFIDNTDLDGVPHTVFVK